jgi:hypothetical protein
MSSTDQDLLDEQVRNLRLESEKLERIIRRMDRPFWTQWGFWRSLLGAGAVGAAAWAAASRLS